MDVQIFWSCYLVSTMRWGCFLLEGAKKILLLLQDQFHLSVQPYQVRSSIWGRGEGKSEGTIFYKYITQWWKWSPARNAEINPRLLHWPILIWPEMLPGLITPTNKHRRRIFVIFSHRLRPFKISWKIPRYQVQYILEYDESAAPYASIRWWCCGMFCITY